MTKGKDQSALRIFLSYAAEDKEHARKLSPILLSHRPEARLFTTETLSAGQDWESILKEEISQCDLFMVLVSRNSVDSVWVLHEFGAAWALDKPIIPVVANMSMLSRIPVTLSQYQVVRIEDIEKPDAIEQVLERYEGVLA
jgi:hypothetical protein